MKREEKTEMMRRRIIDSAVKEFSEKGYDGSSLNEICANEGISKGIIYHYFTSKVVLYLTCVRETFEKLAGFIESNLVTGSDNTEEELNVYFLLRAEFFEKNPDYRQIFCEAVISPPLELCNEIVKCKVPLDKLNIHILQQLLSGMPLRKNITVDEVVRIFCQLQDLISVRYHNDVSEETSFTSYEDNCRRILNILLYGVVERTGDNG